ncbi:cobalamin-binding protein [Ectothiorhodospiraceae bacterium WFHF3C12]|nr:cobalamin-binding protein [Ectothiorhodospiraceae bacterium WFHF3C12]
MPTSIPATVRCLTARLAAAAALLVAATAPAEVSVTDDVGRTVTLESPAQRIVSLAPHTTELLFAAGAGDRVVGAVAHSDYPPEARSIPRVGGYSRLDYERILSLSPDLVIAWASGNEESAIERLEGLGQTVYVSEPRRIGDIAEAMRRFGRLAGTSQTATAAADAFDGRHERLRRRFSDRPDIGVFYQIWKEPLMTVNGEHLIARVIQLCGGHNVFADLTTLAPNVSVESVIAADPEVIVASGMGNERPEWLDDWKQWPSIRAVKRDNLYFVPPQLIQRHSPRILDGAERLCGQLDEARKKRREEATDEHG